MPITDLTGTKWAWKYEYLGSYINSALGTYSINFTDGTNTYSSLKLTKKGTLKQMYFDDTKAYDSITDNPVLTEYIIITGGTDITNATLISFLESAATQQEYTPTPQPSAITDLTGYTWVGNTTLDLATQNPTGEDQIYNLSFTDINNTEYTKINIYDNNYDENPANTMEYYKVNDRWKEAYQNYWLDNVYKTITINGGTDATNSNLIAFLESNGTLTAPAPQPSVIVKIGNLPITKKMFGTLPIVKEVVNGVTIWEETSSSSSSSLPTPEPTPSGGLGE